MPDPIRRTADGIEVDLLVVPNASRSEVVGLHGERVKVRVSSPPERLKANAAVLDLLEDVVGLKRLRIVRGRTTRFKTVLVPTTDVEMVRSLLVEPLKGGKRC